ncbi:MAG: hypothetical protein ACFFE8_01935 [Candidatus Heimdallarchaeota archaeon]
MSIIGFGFCPFRVEYESFRAGCKLQIKTLCYSQHARPLLQMDDKPGYQCPVLHFTLSAGTYEEIESIIHKILKIQDEENTALNIWPMLSGVANPKHKSTTPEGKGIQQLSKKVRDELEQIIYDISEIR